MLPTLHWQLDEVKDRGVGENETTNNCQVKTKTMTMLGLARIVTVIKRDDRDLGLARLRFSGSESLLI